MCCTYRPVFVCLVISFASLNQSILYILCLTKFYDVLVIVAVGIGGVEDARSLDLWFNGLQHTPQL